MTIITYLKNGEIHLRLFIIICLEELLNVVQVEFYYF
jgi:hypothetical protein